MPWGIPTVRTFFSSSPSRSQKSLQNFLWTCIVYSMSVLTLSSNQWYKQNNTKLTYSECKCFHKRKFCWISATPLAEILSLPTAAQDDTTVVQDDNPVARDDTACIRTVAALAEKAVDSENGERFLTTVQPRDLPECWSVTFHKIPLPGCHVDFDAIKKELELNGFPQRKGYFCSTRQQKTAKKISSFRSVLYMKRKHHTYHTFFR